MAKALFAAGCFWHVQDSFDKLPGVLNTVVGYSGGNSSDPTYHQVCSGQTGHAECVLVEFDDSKISFTTLLQHFWQIHDPTTRNKQGPDIGTQYRSAIFYFSLEQKDLAMKHKIELEQAHYVEKPIVTEIVEAHTFYPAENYHQHYLKKNN